MRLPHVLTVLALASAVAGAQPKPDKRAQAQALQLAEDSEKAYKAGQFEKAAGLLRKAHGIYPEPILLYNLGRALEGMGATKEAIDAYEQYLKDARQIDDRPAIERRVATLKDQLDKAEKLRQDEELHRQEAAQNAAQGSAAQTKEPGKEPPPDAPIAPPPAGSGSSLQPLPPQPPVEPAVVDERGTLERVGPWATLGAGGAMVIAGGIFGWRAQASHDDAVNAPSQLAAANAQSDAQTLAAVANVLFVVGGAAILGGAVWEYFEWRSAPRREPPKAARLSLSPTGFAVTWAWW